MALPQAYGVLVAGLGACVVGGFVTAWCAWLEYRLVMSERLACAQVRRLACVEAVQLVFAQDLPSSLQDLPSSLQDLPSSHEHDPEGAAGVWGRVNDPVYHSTTPDILEFDSSV
jgi:hypothetical protein